MKNDSFFRSTLLLFLCVVFFVLASHCFAQDRMPTLEDEQYKTACGPIACFVALKSLGVETSLDEMAKRCDWKQDEFLPLESLQKAIKSYRGIDCQIAQLSPTKLCKLLKDHQTVVCVLFTACDRVHFRAPLKIHTRAGTRVPDAVNAMHRMPKTADDNY